MNSRLSDLGPGSDRDPIGALAEREVGVDGDSSMRARTSGSDQLPLRRCDPGPDPLAHPIDQRQQHLARALEVIVEQPGGEPSLLGDPSDRGLLVAFLGDHLGHGVEDLCHHWRGWKVEPSSCPVGAEKRARGAPRGAVLRRARAHLALRRSDRQAALDSRRVQEQLRGREGIEPPRARRPGSPTAPRRASRRARARRPPDRAERGALETIGVEQAKSRPHILTALIERLGHAMEGLELPLLADPHTPEQLAGQP